VPSEQYSKRRIFQRTAKKELVTIISFLALAIIIEYLIVALFLSFGLEDKYLLTQTFQFPGTTIFFTLSISPLFHLIPIGIIFVLVANWIYLRKYVAGVLRKIEPLKKPSMMPKDRFQKPKLRRFKSIRQFSKSLSKRFERISRSLEAFFNRISAAFLRIRGISYITQRLSLAQASVKSSATVLALFIVSAFALYLLVQPTLIYDIVVGLYTGNPSLPLAIRGISEGIASSPIGGLTTAVNDALAGIAIGFWNTFEGAGKLTESLVQLDLTWKYVICQNIAAWVSALAVWAYGKYSSHLYRRKGR
jgi:hypothetical protein